MAELKKIQILKIQVNVTSYGDAVQRILKWCQDSSGRYICVSNVHMCMEAYDHSNFCKIVNEADLVVPDGVSLVWAQKLMGEKAASQVRGSDLLLKLCAEAELHEIPIGLYGGTEKSLNDFVEFIKNRFPQLIISFFSSPPFRELSREEEKNYIENINKSGISLLFLGIGCPKQEKWMAKHKSNLNCVMIGVGAAFDFFSGQKKHAPIWMQKSGLEWLFRLYSEPRRLWKRYLKHNPRFIYYLLKQIAT
jgi:N-acetylglucosaminyldiphosphoundecaprenol N-acetyl-beta-D-mannosaminyltransferase